MAQPKVRNKSAEAALVLAARTQQDILGLQVTVRHSLCMQVLHGGRDLGERHRDHAHVDAAGARRLAEKVLLHRVLQAAAVAVFHDDVRLLDHAAVLHAGRGGGRVGGKGNIKKGERERGAWGRERRWRSVPRTRVRKVQQWCSRSR
eukprot:364119-Chlamydomonas_euryale.AAC.5